MSRFRQVVVGRALAAALVLGPVALAAAPPESPPPPDEATVVRGLERFLAQAEAEGFTGAVLVARGDRVLLERGYGRIAPGSDRPVTADSVFTTGSITKQFTAAAILVLEQEGKLAVSDPITRYLPGVPEAKRAITIHHLLSHQAGFPGAIGDDFERVARDEFVRRALAAPLLFPPGAGYEYSNVGYSLAAAIVERVAGEPYERFLARKLFGPAGMRATGYLLPRWDASRLAHGTATDGGDWGTVVDKAILPDGPGWHLLGNGGIHSTVGDMLRWHRALRGEAILTAASKATMYAKQADEGGGTWYGYGWSIEPTPWGEAVVHNGGNPFFFADCLRFLEPDVFVYYTTSSRDRRMRRLARPLAGIVFTGEVPELEPAAAPLRAPGSDPAPAGTAAARWRLPGDAAGERAATLLDALAAESPEARRAFAATGFAPEVVTRRGPEGLLDLLERLRGDLGGFTLAGYRPTPAGIEIALASDREPAPFRLKLTVEPAAPHRLAGLSVQIGD